MLKMIDQNELEQVVGGMGNASKDAQNDDNLKRVSCPECHDVIWVASKKKTFTCRSCRKTFEIKG